ncbi:MAG: hypothetical protein VKJ06_00375 [Vampirovibrionales bacterium]|nr:hypothetical protein [Vampirovibrionales bacterium]
MTRFFKALTLSTQSAFALTVLYYPLMLFLLLLFMLTPQATPGGDWRWLLLYALLGLLYLAFTSGWFAMMSSASKTVTEALPPLTPVSPERATDKKPEQPGVLMLLSQFMPGVGRFFGPLLAGALIQLAVFVGLILAAEQTLMGRIPAPLIEVLGRPMASAEALQAALTETLKTLSLSQHQALQSALWITLGCVALLGLIYAATVLWMPLVVQTRVPFWKAYGHSLKRFAKDPFGLILLSVFPLGGVVIAQMLLALNMPLLAVLAQVVLLLWNVVAALLPFMYLSLSGIVQTMDEPGQKPEIAIKSPEDDTSTPDNRSSDEPLTPNASVSSSGNASAPHSQQD